MPPIAQDVLILIAIPNTNNIVCMINPFPDNALNIFSEFKQWHQTHINKITHITKLLHITNGYLYL